MKVERTITNTTEAGRRCAGYSFGGNQTRTLDLSRPELREFQRMSTIFDIEKPDDSSGSDEGDAPTSTTEQAEDLADDESNEYNEFETSLLDIDGIGEASVDDITEYATSMADLEVKLVQDDETPLSDRIEQVLRDHFKISD